MHHFVNNMASHAKTFRHQGTNLNNVRLFFAMHGAALANASQILGGATAEHRYLRLATDLRDATVLTRHLRNELVALHRLLTLENVSDPELAERVVSRRRWKLEGGVISG